mmetsp:Transcript_33066/g.92596  ORF Transcript_33066/g.92596 Transcript_33066/m.92596 type:complete len:370 (+) Transcript_33066:51-1160(+)
MLRLGKEVMRAGMGKRKYVMGGKAYYEPIEWLWNPPPPEVDRDEESGWTKQSRRCGLIAVKGGMLQDYDQWGHLHMLTVIYVPNNYVVVAKSAERDGYDALQVGAFEAKEKHVTRAMQGHFRKAGTPLLRRLSEFPVTPEAAMAPGTVMTARHFLPGQYIDVQGKTIGKGFAGGMKRWGFKGLRASHGVSKAHRSIGSTGACQDPGRVWKGKKMAGHMGDKKRTVRNLYVFAIDPEESILLVRGHVPGKPGNILRIRDSNKGFHEPPPFPTYDPAKSNEADTTELLYGTPKMPHAVASMGAFPPEGEEETIWETRKRLGEPLLAKAKEEYEAFMAEWGKQKGKTGMTYFDHKNRQWRFEREADGDLPWF